MLCLKFCSSWLEQSPCLAGKKYECSPLSHPRYFQGNSLLVAKHQVVILWDWSISTPLTCHEAKFEYGNNLKDNSGRKNMLIFRFSWILLFLLPNPHLVFISIQRQLFEKYIYVNVAWVSIQSFEQRRISWITTAECRFP